MKKLINDSKPNKLVMRRETIARLTSQQFAEVVAGVNRSREENVGPTISDEYICGTWTSEGGC
jgi:hypothetical protein